MTLPALFIDLRDELRVHSTKRYRERAITDIERLYFHHSGVDPRYNGIDRFARGCARYHVNPHGPNLEEWPGIGYGCVIADALVRRKPQWGDGAAAIGLCWWLNVVSYHVGRNNDIGYGCCLDGNFNNYPVTDSMKHSMELWARWAINVVAKAREDADLPPRLLRIMAHREDEWANTLCNGDYGVEVVVQLREKLAGEGLCSL